MLLNKNTIEMIKDYDFLILIYKNYKTNFLIFVEETGR